MPWTATIEQVNKQPDNTTQAIVVFASAGKTSVRKEFFFTSQGQLMASLRAYANDLDDLDLATKVSTGAVDLTPPAQTQADQYRRLLGQLSALDAENTLKTKYGIPTDAARVTALVNQIKAVNIP